MTLLAVAGGLALLSGPFYVLAQEPCLRALGFVLIIIGVWAQLVVAFA